jgi:hypothetical protein
MGIASIGIASIGTASKRIALCHGKNHKIWKVPKSSGIMVILICVHQISPGPRNPLDQHLQQLVTLKGHHPQCFSCVASDVTGSKMEIS